jgi:hypothetical protein
MKTFLLVLAVATAIVSLETGSFTAMSMAVISLLWALKLENS